MAIQVGNSYVSQEAYNYAKARLDSEKSQGSEQGSVLEELSRQFPDTSFSTCTEPFGAQGTNNIGISPKILAKMANDPEARLEYEALIYDCAKLLKNEPVNHGNLKTIARGFIINDDGSLGGWGITQSSGGEKTKSYQKVSREQMKERLEKLKEKKAKEKADEKDVAATYEKSDESESKPTYTINKMSPEERANMVEQLKRDSEARQESLVKLIQSMIGKQAKTHGIANGTAADEAARIKAQKDISEDGYWGVKQTSQRLFDFACALAGDDVDKMHEMQKAMEKGFKQAAKALGGKLTSIGDATHEAANKLFEDYYESKKKEAQRLEG